MCVVWRALFVLKFFVVFCVLCNVRSLLFVPCCSMNVACCALRVVCCRWLCLLFVVFCLVFVVRFVCCLDVDVRCVLCVVCGA